MINNKILYTISAATLLAVAGCSSTACNPNTMTTFDYVLCGGKANVDQKVSDKYEEWVSAQRKGLILRKSLNNLQKQEKVLREQLQQLRYENSQLKNEIEQLVAKVNAATNNTSKAVIAEDIERSVNKMADNLDRFASTVEYAIQTDNFSLLQEIIETASDIKDIDDIRQELKRTKSESRAMRLAGKKIANKVVRGGAVSTIVRLTPWGRMVSVFLSILSFAD